MIRGSCEDRLRAGVVLVGVEAEIPLTLSVIQIDVTRGGNIGGDSRQERRVVTGDDDIVNLGCQHIGTGDHQMSEVIQVYQNQKLL